MPYRAAILAKLDQLLACSGERLPPEARRFVLAAQEMAARPRDGADPLESQQFIAAAGTLLRVIYGEAAAERARLVAERTRGTFARLVARQLEWQGREERREAVLLERRNHVSVLEATIDGIRVYDRASAHRHIAALAQFHFDRLAADLLAHDARVEIEQVAAAREAVLPAASLQRFKRAAFRAVARLAA